MTLGSFTNYNDKQGGGYQNSIFYRIQKGRDQLSSKFYQRSLWMPPNEIWITKLQSCAQFSAGDTYDCHVALIFKNPKLTSLGTNHLQKVIIKALIIYLPVFFFKQ